MDYKYYRDLKHNYIVATCPENSDKKDSKYQLKIMESGRVEGVLKSSPRTINQEKFLYYDITSMMSLGDRFSSSGMSYDELIRMFADMKKMLESLSEYLLGEEGVIFDAKSVFVNLTNGDYRFVYYPYEHSESSFADFVDSLIEVIDHEDERAVELVYGLSDRAQIKELMLLDMIKDILKDKEETQAEDVSSSDTSFIQDAEMDYFEEDMEIDKPEPESRMDRAKRRLGGKVQLLFGLMFMLVIAGVVYVRMNYILSKEENLLSIAVMLISGITGAIAFYSGVKAMKSAPKTRKEPAKEADYEDDYDYMDDNEDFEDFNAPIQVMSTSKNMDKTEKVATASYQETVVLDEETNPNMTLYSRNLDKTVRICLDKLPITIGKMEGCVDKVLSDISVSRIHCKIVKDNNGIALIDLGSTNGSYRNGLKLIPQEKTYIEEGDEVKLGRICFDLR